MTPQFQRQTAFKLWISEIITAPFINPKQELTPSYIITRDLQISRTNIIGICIDKQTTENYSSITIDDSTAQIQARVWNEDIKNLEKIQPGQVINLIGKIKQFNNQTYIVPEITREIEKDWLLIRNLELKKSYKEPIKQEQRFNQEEPIVIEMDNVNQSPLSKREIILKLIEKLDDKQGADIIEVIEQSKLPEQDAEKIIKELIKEGEIFEIKSGRLRTIM